VYRPRYGAAATERCDIYENPLRSASGVVDKLNVANVNGPTMPMGQSRADALDSRLNAERSPEVPARTLGDVSESGVLGASPFVPEESGCDFSKSTVAAYRHDQLVPVAQRRPSQLSRVSSILGRSFVECAEIPV